jgi:hypothetical protein
MTAESAHDSHHHHPSYPEHHDTPPMGDATLIPLYARVEERRRFQKEREMFNAFVNYSQENMGVDPRTDDPAQGETIALSAQGFLSRTVQRRIEMLGKLAEETGEPAPRVHVLPPAPVERNIHWYYKEFGYNRRTKSDEVRRREDAWLKQHMGPSSPIHTKVRIDSTDEEGNPTIVKVPRANYFQEIALGLELERVLRAQQYEVAADSVETLLGAYGAWFPQRIREAMQGRRSTTRTTEKDSRMVFHFNAGDILNDLPPDKPQKPLPSSK